MQIQMRNIIILIVALLSVFSNADDIDIATNGNPTTHNSYVELKALPIKMLRFMLSSRGLECKGCAEKDDFIKMAFENQHLPILPPKEKEEEKAPAVPVKEEESEEKKKKDLDDIMENLRKGGFGGAKMFTKDDLEGLSAEDMASKVYYIFIYVYLYLYIYICMYMYTFISLCIFINL
jgi:hypothetical protein